MPITRIAWDIPAKENRHIAFSQSTGYICTVSKDGEVACYGSNGAKRFSTVVAGANRAAISPDGNYILAYSYRNPVNKSLTFLDSTGKIYWQMDVSGAVWSADAGLCNDRALFAVGTGSRHIYLLTVGDGIKRFRRWRTAGVVCSITLDKTAENIIYGTWQASSICRTDLEGHRDWEVEADPASLQYIQSMSDSDRLFLRTQPNNSGLDGEAKLIELDGTSLNSLPLAASIVKHTIPSPDGIYVCVSYTKTIQHSGKSVMEKHAVLYDYAGRQLWDKGSMLLQVTPILVAEGGYVLISSSSKALLVVNPMGEIKQACKLPAAMLSSAASKDGSQAMITCADGRIYYLSINQ